MIATGTGRDAAPSTDPAPERPIGRPLTLESSDRRTDSGRALNTHGGSIALLLVALAGCAGGPRAPVRDAVGRRDVPAALAAYDRFREVDGTDLALLGEIAALVLEAEALSGEPRRRDAALTQLRLAGNAGLPTLRRLADAEGDALLRARALEALTRRGDRQARAFLYALLDNEDPEVVATAIPSIDAEEEIPRLLAYLRDTDPGVRRAAALSLSSASESLQALDALAETSRVDPEPRVRAAAARALGSFGGAAAPFLRERLGDADARVRFAAVGALLRADRSRAAELLAPFLATPPSRAGIEAARLIALGADDGDDSNDGDARRREDDARLYLLGALEVDDPSLRAQAAVALASLPADDATDRRLARALAEEAEAPVKLGLARALLRGAGHDGQAQAALLELLAGEGMAAVQAAALLSKDGREEALRRLERALAGDDALLRRVAARALGAEAHRPDEVRALLHDEDPMVRIYAAGGILAATND